MSVNIFAILVKEMLRSSPAKIYSGKALALPERNSLA
jgi:hypothetical protein